ncbi:MAG: autorepressor SdpR family transcription factor [Pseudomonadota bacterium]
MGTQSLFKALADPTRREILRLLRKGSMNAGELAEAFTITKASLSHHFNLLKQADLVRTERRGQQIVYSLNTTVLQDAAGMLMDMIQPEGTPNSEELSDDV